VPGQQRAVTARLEVSEDPASIAAAVIVAALRDAITRRGRATLALSGGGTPVPMFAALAATTDLPWDVVDVLQVDERVAPAGSPDRNLTPLAVALGGLAPLHPLPVNAGALTEAAEQAGAELADLAGDPPVLDVVHLGLGDDGHTASLAPGDPLSSADEPLTPPVAVVRGFNGFDRLTVTLPVLTRARTVVWLVTGSDKAPHVARVLALDPAVPGGRVAAARAAAGTDGRDVVAADPAAAASAR
jgi:6-phosphogluconolactonase